MFALPFRLLPLLGSTVPEALGPALDLLSAEEVRRSLALGLYLEKTFTADQAAQLAGLDRASFLKHVAIHGAAGTASQSSGVDLSRRDVDPAEIGADHEALAFAHPGR